MAKKHERKRVSSDRVRQNAREGDHSPSFFKGKVKTWRPEKKGRVDIDVLPYEVTDPKHPDEVEPGTIWYKRVFKVHRGIGPENKSFVCPLSIKEPCPIHEDWIKLGKKGKTDEDVLKKLKGQDFIAMNIRDPDDSDGVVVYCDTCGKLWGADAGLSKELDEGDEKNASFFDVKGGKTLSCRFSEESFKTKEGSAKFLRVSRIDFKDRKDMKEDDVLEKTHNLDEILNVLPYEKLKEIYLQTSTSKGSDSSAGSSSSESESGSSSEKSSKDSGSGSKSSSEGNDSSSGSSSASEDSTK